MKVSMKRKPDQVSIGICVAYGQLVNTISIGLIFWVLTITQEMPGGTA